MTGHLSITLTGDPDEIAAQLEELSEEIREGTQEISKRNEHGQESINYYVE